MPLINTDTLITVAEFAKELDDGTTADAVRKHCARGVIKAVKAGTSWLIPKDQLPKFKKSRRQPGRPPLA